MVLIGQEHEGIYPSWRRRITEIPHIAGREQAILLIAPREGWQKAGSAWRCWLTIYGAAAVCHTAPVQCHLKKLAIAPSLQCLLKQPLPRHPSNAICSSRLPRNPEMPFGEDALHAARLVPPEGRRWYPQYNRLNINNIQLGLKVFCWVKSREANFMIHVMVWHPWRKLCSEKHSWCSSNERFFLSIKRILHDIFLWPTINSHCKAKLVYVFYMYIYTYWLR